MIPATPRADAGGAASLRALLRLADDANDADAERRRALAEGRRRVFDPFEERTTRRERGEREAVRRRRGSGLDREI